MDTAQETTIYKNYRAVLAFNKLHRLNHAAQRRQSARQTIVARYDIPFAELKALIAKHDLLEGITHEKGPDYQNQLEYDTAVKLYDMNPTACRCGNDDMVRVRPHPFRVKKDGSLIMTTLCYLCYRKL